MDPLLFIQNIIQDLFLLLGFLISYLILIKIINKIIVQAFKKLNILSLFSYSRIGFFSYLNFPFLSRIIVDMCILFYMLEKISENNIFGIKLLKELDLSYLEKYSIAFFEHLPSMLLGLIILWIGGAIASKIKGKHKIMNLISKSFIYYYSILISSFYIIPLSNFVLAVVLATLSFLFLGILFSSVILVSVLLLSQRNNRKMDKIIEKLQNKILSFLHEKDTEKSKT